MEFLFEPPDLSLRCRRLLALGGGIFALFCPSKGEAYGLPAWLARRSVYAKEGGWRATVAAAMDERI